MILEGSFDGMTSLAALYLWLMFSYLSSLLNCDLQRVLHNNVYVKNLFGLIAFYFLFTILDPNSTTSVGVTFAKTIIVYLLFMMVTKSKWYFSVTAIALLLVDQILKNHISYLRRNDASINVDRYEKVRFALQITMIILIIVGYIHYFAFQWYDHRDDFSWLKFIFGTIRCKSV